MIELSQPAADLGGFDANDGIVGGVVVYRPAKHFGADHSLLEGIGPVSEGMFDDQMQEFLSALAAHKGRTCEDIAEVLADLGGLIRCEPVGFSRGFRKFGHN